MKKLILLLFVTLLSSCMDCKEQDPLRYKGCIVVDKDCVWIKLKLNSEMRDSLNEDYIWIVTTKEDAKYFNIGDTIQ